jgi:diguanylate cyclase (GGDEF)-like protein/PAS domain S-box-containing protein
MIRATRSGEGILEKQLTLSKTNPKYLVAASCTLFLVQALSIATLGHRRPGPAVSDFVQLALGLICIVSCFGAISRSQGMGRHIWQLFTTTFAMWELAQALGVYIDLTQVQSLARFDDILFFLSLIPFGALPFLDPNAESDSFDRLHIVDFVQVCVLWFSILLLFSGRIWATATAFEFGPFIWSRNLVFDALLAFTFTLRGLCSRRQVVRSFFLRMALFLLLSGLADSYALNPKRNLESGGWFDLIWSALLAIPIVIASTWKGGDRRRVDAPGEPECLATNRLLPILYPMVSFGALAYVGRAYPLLSASLFTLAFVAFAARVLIIQRRLNQREIQLQIDIAKRMRAEETLQESEIQYRLLFESNPVPLWVFDRATLRFLQVNEAAIRHYGYSRDEFLSMTIDQIRPKEDVPALLKELDHPTPGLEDAGAWRHITNTGAIIDVEVVTHDLKYHEIDAELVAVRDVTERKKAEETAQRLAAIVEFSQDAIIGKNLDGVITAWNRGAEKLYGYAGAEVIGRDLSVIVPPEKKPEVTAILEAVRDGKSIEGFETHRNTKKGLLIDVALSISPTRDSNGRVTGASTIARDITLRKRSEEQLKLQSAALEAAANAIVITDSKGTILWINESFTTMTGYAKEEIVGKNPRVLKSGEQPESYYASLWSTLKSGKTWSGELINKRKDGTTYAEEMTITPVTHESYGTANTYFIAIKRDVSERRSSDEALLLKNALLEAQTETTIDGILVVDEYDRVILANKRFGYSFGIPAEMLSKRDDLVIRRFVMEQVEDPYGFVAKVNYLNEHRDEKSRDELKLKDGKVFDRYSAPLVDSKRRYRGRIWYFRDITDRKVADERVRFLAYYDALTGLPNRTLFRDRMSKALAGARRQKHKMAFLFLDLDRFKDINDSLGHSVGDLLLQEVAERLKAWGRAQDTIARVGGDEFLIMLTHVNDSSDAAVAAERLMDTMCRPFAIQGHSLTISCSVGISVFPEHGADGEALVKNADAAMYNAKANGRNNLRFFTSDMSAQVLERITLENSLRSAMGKDELFLAYQPQMEIATGRITGLEALLRWRNPHLGLVSPDRFIPIAENSGLIVPLGEWVLRTACRQAREWQTAGLPRVSMAVNVSAVQFRQEGFCDLVKKVLSDTGLDPQFLELELTESLLLANAEAMVSVVKDLKALGITVAIDDFGTGYSSFSYLKRFQLNKFKIDRSFIRDVAVNPEDATITSAIISMAKSLKLKVIAEGVETEAQMQFLRDHQCDEIQGFYFSKPLSVEEVSVKLKRLEVRRRATAH